MSKEEIALDFFHNNNNPYGEMIDNGASADEIIDAIDKRVAFKTKVMTEILREKKRSLWDFFNWIKK